ncbi:hypothetical protein C8F01DRAFT_1254697 [Mycena amicta]|nr:hypothetical protein C8F01DRAFT_1254697 [Mycena amicta]
MLLRHHARYDLAIGCESILRTRYENEDILRLILDGGYFRDAHNYKSVSSIPILSTIVPSWARPRYLTTDREDLMYGTDSSDEEPIAKRARVDHAPIPTQSFRNDNQVSGQFFRDDEPQSPSFLRNNAAGSFQDAIYSSTESLFSQQPYPAVRYQEYAPSPVSSSDGGFYYPAPYGAHPILPTNITTGSSIAHALTPVSDIRSTLIARPPTPNHAATRGHTFTFPDGYSGPVLGGTLVSLQDSDFHFDDSTCDVLAAVRDE